MNINDQIHAFINSPYQDYFMGVSLFRKISSKRTLIQHLIKKENRYNKEKLNYELKKHLIECDYDEEPEKINKENASLREWESNTSTILEDQQSSNQEVNVSKSIATGASGCHADSTFLNDHTELKVEQLKLKRNDLYAQRDSLHGQLHRCRIDPERFKVAQKIMQIQPKIDKLNIRINIIYETGQLDRLTIEQGMSSDQFKRLQLVETYIKRYKLKEKQADSLKDKSGAQSKINKYEREKLQILNNE